VAGQTGGERVFHLLVMGGEKYRGEEKKGGSRGWGEKKKGRRRGFLRGAKGGRHPRASYHRGSESWPGDKQVRPREKKREFSTSSGGDPLSWVTPQERLQGVTC